MVSDHFTALVNHPGQKTSQIDWSFGFINIFQSVANSPSPMEKK